MSQIAPWLRELLRDPVNVSPLTDAEHMPPTVLLVPGLGSLQAAPESGSQVQVQAPGADYYLVNREATRAYPVRDGVAMLLPR